jgi:oligoendopeptidase F
MAVQTATGAEEVVWNLGDLFAGVDDPAIESTLAEVNAKADRFAEQYRGRVATLDGEELVDALYEAEQFTDIAYRLFSFAQLGWAADTTNPANGALLQKIREASSQIQQKTLFFELEWANVSDDQAKLADNQMLARWQHYLHKQRRMRPYLLSEPEEKILAEKSVNGIQAWTRFFNELMSASRYELDGEQLPQDVVLRKLYTPEREVRKRAAAAITAGLRDNLKTTTYVFNTVLAEKASDDRLRKYPTWISSRNLDNEASDETVEALVQAVTSRYDIVARYYDIKRRLLGLDELYEYDRYAPLAQAETFYTWDEARDMVLNAFNIFHPRVAEIAKEFFDKDWIHAPARPGKRGGAFASPGAPSAHPYVLVNYTGIGRDVTTLAHELGHGVHMYLSRPKGVFEAYPPLTTSEMASVFGEMLVFTDLMNRETDRSVQLAMLASKIEDTFATVFRQTSMNRFENAIHTARRAEGELTSERFSQLWLETQRAMFNKSVTLTDDYGIWWSYIPHFLNTPGYVYAYAFGELLVLALFNIYKQEGAPFAPKYLDVLSAGGADTPENILAKVGVDLTDPKFWHQGLNTIDEMVTQLEGLV